MDFKISIITPSLNQGKYIEECILSVANQGYPNFEHIIVDGKSNDNTIETLKKYNHVKWISEKDKGISDALNKGLKMAKGDIVGWLNCDDYYLPGTFADVACNMRNFDVKWVIGNNKKQYDQIQVVQETFFFKINLRSLSKNCDGIRTNAAFFRKEVLEEIEGFDVSFKMVMDYDLFVRLAQKYEPLNVNKYYHVFRVHDKQITSYKNLFFQYKELLRIFLRERYFYAMGFKGFKTIRTFNKHNIKSLLIFFGLISSKYKNLPYSLRKRRIS